MAERTCKVEDCDGVTGVPGAARGYCQKHYTRVLNTGTTELPAIECAVPDCVTILGASNKSGYCTPHSDLRPGRRERHTITERERRAKRRAQQERPVCAYKDCTNMLRANNRSGYCKQHFKHSPARKQQQREWRSRTDRPCRARCGAFCRPSCMYCADCDNERTTLRKRLQRDGEVARLFEKQRGICPPTDYGGCGLPMTLGSDLEIDHILPVSRGGTDDESNKQLMHGFCNQSKRDKLVPAVLTLQSPAVA